MTVLKMAGDQFTDVIKSLDVLLNKCRINFTSEGLSVIAVDAANVAMVKIDLSKDYFLSYQSSTNEIGIDIKKWKHIHPKKTDEVIIDFNHVFLPDGKTCSLISINNDRWKIENVDPNAIRKNPNPPILELPICHIVEASLINSAITNGSVFSDKIKFRSEDKCLITFCEGDTGNYTRYIESECNTDKTAVSIFALDYMKEIFKFLKNNRKIELHMAHDHPIRIVKKNFGNDVNSSLEYLLAPRFEED